MYKFSQKTASAQSPIVGNLTAHEICIGKKNNNPSPTKRLCRQGTVDIFARTRKGAIMEDYLA